jgi:tRNA(Ile2) C34 agmatinyltransferase TiaS
MDTTETDLELLKGADLTLMANGEVDAGIALNDAIVELRSLRKLVAARKPVCPHCKTEMIPTEYKGYYDGFTYWGCACGDVPGVEKTWKGGFA